MKPGLLRNCLSVASECAVIIMVIALTVLYVHQRQLAHAQPRNSANISAVSHSDLRSPSSQFDLRQMHLSPSRASIVLALSTTCPYCKANLEFYRTLSKEHKNDDLIALFPQNRSSVAAYLKDAELVIPEKNTIDFSAFGIVATPTVLLVGPDGTILRSWVGALSAEQQQEVLGAL